MYALFAKLSALGKISPRSPKKILLFSQLHNLGYHYPTTFVIISNTYSMEELKKPRFKAFVSMDSLWYEEERLATFIDWPVPFISCTELAREGFYYLRTKDHCACAFCRGIIGAWEEGDTPRGEHKRHFPHCPFVQGKATPNIPLRQGRILASVTTGGNTPDVVNNTKGEDVCGTKSTLKENVAVLNEERVVLKSSDSDLSMSSLGFRQYCGPKRKEYLTTSVRHDSFKHWPEKVKQTPRDLAEAGFYYCGLSDHVRCFHCGNGLRNWEPEDEPWEEHARWFPDCHYVLLKKGLEFVDKVRRERPPYIPNRNRNNSSSSASTSSAPSGELSDAEMEELMELEIMKHVLEMGFAKHIVIAALRKRIVETGQPFNSVEACVYAVLMIIDDETKNTIESCENITYQARKMAALQASTNSTSNSYLLQEAAAPVSLPPLPNNNVFITALSQTLPPLPNSRTSPPLRASTPTTQLESPQSVDVEMEPVNETMESTETPATESSNSEPNTTAPERETAPVSAASEAEEESRTNSRMELSSDVSPLISEANDALEQAKKLLGTSISSSPPSSLISSSTVSSSSAASSSNSSSLAASSVSSSSSPSSITSSACSSAESSQETVSRVDPNSSQCDTEEMKIYEEVIKKENQNENLAEELERIRENRLCKVCMDKEMDVVFLPCTHMVACSSCVVALASCPICRREIKFAFRPIMS